MSISLSRWVLAIFLLLLLPVPVWQQQLGWLPVVEQWRYLLVQFSFLLMLQAIANGIFCILLAFIYGVISKQWPLKVRGAVVGIITLSLIIIVSTWSFYLPLSSTDGEFLELRQIYVKNG